jgi:hypothetical protein
LSYRKLEIKETFRKKFEYEKLRLYDDNERSIRELQELERKKIEENT